VLIALLLPTLNRAREHARGVQCLSNLRQMVVMSNMYVTNNQGRYPVAFYFAFDGTTTYHYSWDFTKITTPATTQVVTGLLWEGKGTLEIQQCPSFEGSDNAGGEPYTGYNYNTSYIGHGEGESTQPSNPPAKATSVRHTAETVIFGDGQYADGANKYMRAPLPNPGDDKFVGRFAGTQGYRHRGRTNVAFCDGHAESSDARYTANADGAVNVAAGTGFLSKDNELYDLN
jgi:prepilin-type processing-associated H-X9-DG protein